MLAYFRIINFERNVLFIENYVNTLHLNYVQFSVKLGTFSWKCWYQLKQEAQPFLVAIVLCALLNI